MLLHASVLALLSAASTPSGSLDASALASPVREQVVAWRRDFHRHPELGNRETRTAGIVAAHLRKLGLKVETGVAKTGVVALVRGRSAHPLLVIRADMDALPVTEETGLPFASKASATFRGETVGVMHACGHDGHTAVLMGVATALAQVQSQLQGSVLLVFQPAEEGPPEGEAGGAKLMLDEGLFKRYAPDAALGMHLFSNFPVGTIAVRSGPVMAESDSFKIIVSGQQTHGSRPWSGVDPVLAAARIVDGLQSVVSRRVDLTRSTAVVSVGAIKGGIRYNIIPDRVEMVGTIRSFEDSVREAIFADVQRIAEHTASAHHATAQVSFDRHTVVTVNDPALTERLKPALARTVGAGKLVEAPLSTVAEDFAYFTEVVPSLYFFVGATPVNVDVATAPSNHSPKFDIDETSLDVSVRALLETTFAYFDTAAN